ncbi:MAG: acyl-CoA dehydrogenase family protein [Nocardioides sp.]
MTIHPAEQQALVAAVRSLLEKRADSAAVRRADGFDADLWRALTEQIGVAALPIPEEHGGAGASIVESALVLEEIGYRLAPVPLLSSLIAAYATDDPALLERIASGEVCAVVVSEPLVLDGGDATLVLALTDDGTVLLEGATATPVRAMDPTLRLGAVDVTTATRTPVPGDPQGARDAALIGLTALAAGCARRGLDMTVEYAKQREQFGRPIGSFQALKHRMADLLVLVESTVSAARAAARCELDPRAAAAYAKEAVARVAAETIQLHGGIAITWEHDAQLVFKRAHALGQLFGQAHELRGKALASYSASR